MQCCSGHILCRPCYERVCHDEKPTCPTCRETLDPCKPIRNMLAEQSIARLAVACPNEGCHAHLTRGVLAHHLASECAYRAVSCKYAAIGCKWAGVASALPNHEEECKKGDAPGWKLLKRVVAINKDRETRHASELASANAGAAVIEMLSSRCRNIEFTSVQMHKCSAHEHIAGVPAHLVSATFHALGFRWKLFTISESSSSRYSVVLQLRDSRVPLPADFFVLRGQPLEFSLKPASSSHKFANRHRSSEPLLIAESSAADALADFEALTLRIGLVDKRPGRLDRGFMGQMHGGGYGAEPDWGDEDDSEHGSLHHADDSEGDYSESDESARYF